MNLMRWKKPSSDISLAGEDLFSSLQKDINDLFSSLWVDNSQEKSLQKQNNWYPRIEFKETPKEFILKADLPGFDKKDVHISFEENILTLKGERRTEEKKEDHKVHYRECYYGTFERSFNLPEKQIDKENISATFENGVLKVSLAKKSEKIQEKRKIEIN